jgi:threonine aldolase
VLAADYYFNERVNKMSQYYEEAQELAAYYNQCPSVSTTPLEPVSNMFHVHFDAPKERVEPILIKVMEATGIGLTNHLKEISEQACYFEASIRDQSVRVFKETKSDLFKKVDGGSR